MEVSEVHSAKQGLTLGGNQNPAGESTLPPSELRIPSLDRERQSVLWPARTLCSPSGFRFLPSSASPDPLPALRAVYFRTAVFHLFVRLYSPFVVLFFSKKKKQKVTLQTFALKVEAIFPRPKRFWAPVSVEKLLGSLFPRFFCVCVCLFSTEAYEVSRWLANANRDATFFLWFHKPAFSVRRKP